MGRVKRLAPPETGGAREITRFLLTKVIDF